MERVVVDCITGVQHREVLTAAEAEAFTAWQAAIMALPAPPDPAAELAAAIEAADSLEELKAALLGKLRPARVDARPLRPT